MTKFTPALTHGVVTNLFTDVKDMDKASDVIGRAGIKVQHLSHRVAMSIIAHSFTNKDLNFVRRSVIKLFESLPEMVRRNALLDWFNTFGNFTVAMDKQVLVITMVKDAKPDLAKADKTPFWKLTPEKPYEFVDPTKMLESMIAKLRKDEAKGRENNVDIDHTQLINALMAAKGHDKSVAVPAPAPAETGPILTTNSLPPLTK